MMHPGIDLARFRVRSDIELRRRVGIPPDATLVSLVGRLQPWKGQREFLYAAAGLVSAHRNAYFAIVGGAILGWEGDYPQELQRLVLELGIEDRVTFTGHTTEVPRWMAASDVVVNASDPEPFGLVVLEAMASGCAVVAVEKGGPRDIVEPGRNGLLCASREPAALGPAMRRLIEDPGLRDELGQAARIRVERAFTREKMTARFVTILERTARRR
jgi:glycosyltransferase involved in cell wall biosynthesis